MMSDATKIIEKLSDALSRFTTDVFNDNGDITWGRPSISTDDIRKAYWAQRDAERYLKEHSHD